MKIKYALIACIAVVLVGASIAFGYFIAKNPSEYNNGTMVIDVSTTSTEKTEDTEKNETQTQATTQEKTEAASKAQESTKENTTAGKAGEYDIRALLIGSWKDDADLTGFEFFSDNTVKVTYFNMQSLNLGDIIDGKYSGTYKLDGESLTIRYTIYSKSVEKKYKVSVTETTLTLINEKGEKSVFTRKTENEDVKSDNIDQRLIGKWSSEMNGYEFKENGRVKITYIDLSSMGISLPFDGSAEGNYSVKDGILTISYSIYTGLIEKSYKYEINDNILTLTDTQSGESGDYQRKS